MASASGAPRRLGRRHSTTQAPAPYGHALKRHFSDPFHEIHSAPPQQPRASWHTSAEEGHTSAGADYFSFPAGSNVKRSVSPLTVISIPEEAETDGKVSTFLTPPQETYGSRRTISLPLLDTSDARLVDTPGATPTEDLQIVTSPLGFLDAEDVGSLSLAKYRNVHCRWWPSFILPPPYFLYVTLFPTIQDFRSKTWFQKIVAILAIPAVFCLTITLPVVDNESSELEGEIKLASGPTSPNTLLSSVPESDFVRVRSDSDDVPLVPRLWNRWLTGVQCICAPLFIVFIFFRTFSAGCLIVEDNDSLLIPMLYALVAGLAALLLLLIFTSQDKPPKWHKALCAVGFVVAISWISTIADEVVGILRAFGAIVNVSEAILGVTVFAMVII